MGVSVCKGQRAKPREKELDFFSGFLKEVAVVLGGRRRSHFQSFLSNLVSPGRDWRGTIWSSSREEEVSLAKEVVFWFSSPSPHNNAGQWTFQKLICAALSQPLLAVKLLLRSWDNKLSADSAATQIKHNVVLKPDFSFEATWMKYPKIILRWHKVLK